MDYSTSAILNVSPDAAIATACSLFMANGFKVEQPSATEIIAVGPGMQSTSENPIMGITRAEISVSSDTVYIRTELGGVQFMQRFVFIFPPALFAFLFIPLLALADGPWYRFLLVFAPIVPWLFISPMIVGWIKNRTTKAVDVLIHNISNVAVPDAGTASPSSALSAP